MSIAYSNTINLINGINEISYNSFAPFVLTIDPRNVQTNNKIKQIEYIWGDGETDIIKYKPNPQVDVNLPFSTDIGNPLNYKKTHTFYSKDLTLSNYTVNVNFYQFNSSEIVTYTINLKLKNPDLDYDDNAIFKEFHLVKTRMFDSDDKLLYTFQGIDDHNDEHILMSTVDWKSKPAVSIIPKTFELPYPLVAPFENNHNTEVFAIKTKAYANVPVNPDDGTQIIFQPTQTPTPTMTPSVTPTPSITPSVTPTPSITPSMTPTPTPTPTPTSITISGPPDWYSYGGTYYQVLYAKVYDNTRGLYITSTGSMLGVFDATQPTGLYVYDGVRIAGEQDVSNSGVFIMQIFANVLNATGYTYKVYNSQTSEIKNIIETVDFVNNAVLGSVNNPIILNTN